ncbi:hypothetical protein [Microbulbifer hydrolyticus]|uniref:PA domain-containing protein n=1 Tax=Microbulbifer hydrolyticus TaxID=48074 RepID=A0A6P1TDE3_9GAMM|nr:hypothetical protein [Microbulbifer hydrolyticus]MBB5211992.1 hypothetical protein [Microbulbifer hydrolyticus]QHQ39673.1 hypothetical protein GTQ55_12210 [Microbulbifer hydrolyticus]
MLKTTRRAFLASTALLPLARAAGASDTMTTTQSIAADLGRYIGFGSKQAGGSGDNACGEWLAAELQGAGFSIERQTFTAPYFEARHTDIVSGDARADVWPQPVVIPTPTNGIHGNLIRVGAQGQSALPVADAIALIDLPYGRWSSALASAIRAPIENAFAAGARAAVVVTNGPTGKVIALNTDGRKPMFAGPVALLAPEDAAPFFAAAQRGEKATLRLSGESGRRPAFNFVGRIDRNRSRWLVVSTPRSGWFTCAGERGPGIAAWLQLARWASRSITDYNLAFICNSGHEYEYLGAEESLKAVAPRPEETAFWLHLGANMAARDWHGITGKLAPLPGADSQRYLVVSPSLLPAARRIFSGLSGLEAPYSSKELSAGELTGIIKAGYPSVAGVFGLHRFHHVIDDDARCVSTESVAAAATAFQRLLAQVTRTA